MAPETKDRVIIRNKETGEEHDGDLSELFVTKVDFTEQDLRNIKCCVNSKYEQLKVVQPRATGIMKIKMNNEMMQLKTILDKMEDVRL